MRLDPTYQTPVAETLDDPDPLVEGQVVELVGLERVGETDHLKEGLIQPQLTVSLKEYGGYVSHGEEEYLRGTGNKQGPTS